MRLRYSDDDGDFVTVDGHQGVRACFGEWWEMNEAMLGQERPPGGGGVGQMSCTARAWSK